MKEMYTLYSTLWNFPSNGMACKNQVVSHIFELVCRISIYLSLNQSTTWYTLLVPSEAKQKMTDFHATYKITDFPALVSKVLLIVLIYLQEYKSHRC